MDKVTIPPEVVLSMRPHICPYICGPDVVCRVCENRALAAARAMLAAWPGAGDEYPGDGTPCLILPLTEKPDAE